jgi:hypothetical protein
VDDCLLLQAQQPHVAKSTCGLFRYQMCGLFLGCFTALFVVLLGSFLIILSAIGNSPDQDSLALIDLVGLHAA